MTDVTDVVVLAVWNEKTTLIHVVYSIRSLVRMWRYVGLSTVGTSRQQTGSQSVSQSRARPIPAEFVMVNMFCTVPIPWWIWRVTEEAHNILTLSPTTRTRRRISLLDLSLLELLGEGANNFFTSLGS